MPEQRPLRAIFVDIYLVHSSGVTQIMYKFARHRQPELVDLLIVSLERPGQVMLEMLGLLGIPVVHIGNADVLRTAARLRRVMADHAADLVVASSFRCYLAAKLATLGTGKPVVFWIHSVNHIHTRRVKSLLFQLLGKRDALIYVSQAVGENNRPRGHRGRSAVIYNSVEAPELRPEWHPYPPEQRAELGIPPGAIVLGYTAQFCPEKDHATLLSAFDRLSRRVPNLYLVLTGEGEGHAAAVARAGHFPAGDRILFLGVRKDARALLGLFDLYVHTASEEAFGLAAVEAMLARRPVIAARAYGLTELVRDGETGLLFETGDVQDLERQITRLIEDPSYAAQLAAAGEQDCRRRFPPEPFAQQMTAFLQEVRGPHPRGGRRA